MKSLWLIALSLVILCAASLYPQNQDVAPRQQTNYLGITVRTPLCFGNSGDTALIQAAITALGTNGGQIILNGCQAGALTISTSLTHSLELTVINSLTLTAQLVLPGLTHLVGRSGGIPNQFQHGPVATVVPPSGSSAAIKVIGQNGQELENISLNNCSGPCILIDGANQLSALILMRNVSASSGTAAAGIPLVIDSAFWVWMEHCSFLAGGIGTATVPASIRITTSSTSFSSAGLIYLSDSIISGYGVQMDATATVNLQGGFYAKHVIYEGARNSMFRIDSTNGVVASVELSAVDMSDVVSANYYIEEYGATPKGIRSVILEAFSGGPNTTPLTNAQILGLTNITGDGFDYDTGYNLGSAQRRWVQIRRGEIDAEWDGGHTANQFQMVPFPTLAVPQDVTTWSGLSGGGGVTTGIVAPDGSTSAAKLSTGLQVWNAGTSPALAVGDWVIAGVWVRSEDASMPSPVATNGVFVTMNGGTGNTFDSGSSSAFLDGDVARRVGIQWSYVWVATKILTIGGSPPALIFTLSPTSMSTADFWMPWMAHIVSGAMSDQDVMRVVRSVGSLPSGLSGGGSISLAPNQSINKPKLTGVPTSCTSQPTGTVWTNSGVLGLCP